MSSYELIVMLIGAFAGSYTSYRLGYSAGLRRSHTNGLLAALKALVNAYVQLSGDGLTTSTAPPVLTDALTAIEKAEGRQ